MQEKDLTGDECGEECKLLEEEQLVFKDTSKPDLGCLEKGATVGRVSALTGV